MESAFEKQRDLLVQEITAALDSVAYNLDVLNRSLNESIQVGKQFENVGRLWSTFYNGETSESAAAEAQTRETGNEAEDAAEPAAEPAPRTALEPALEPAQNTGTASSVASPTLATSVSDMAPVLP